MLNEDEDNFSRETILVFKHHIIEARYRFKHSLKFTLQPPLTPMK
jgi:hypothetical protein